MYYDKKIYMVFKGPEIYGIVDRLKPPYDLASS